MDLAHLKRILADHTSEDHVLTLPASALESSSVDTAFAAYLDGATLRITGVEGTDGETELERHGTGMGVPFEGMSIRAVFTVVEGDAQVRLSAEAPDGWSLATPYPALSQTLVGDLSTRAQSLELNTSPPSGGVKQLVYTGTAAVEGVMKTVAWLFGEPDSIQLSGAIGITKGRPTMILSGPSAPEVSVGFLGIENSAFQVRTSLPPDATTDTPLAASFALVSTIDFTAGGTSVGIPLAAQFGAHPRWFLLSADLNDAIDTGLDDLVSLADGTPLGTVLPPDFHLGDELRFSDLSLQINPMDRRLESVAFGVGSANSWKLLTLPSGNAIEVADIWAGFRYLPHASKDKLNFSMFGSARLGTAGQLRLAASYPEFAFYGGLDEGSKLDLSDLVAETVAPHADLPDVEVSHLDFSVSPQSGAYSVAATVDSDWKVSIGSVTLALIEVGFSADHPAGGELDAEVFGTLGIGPATVAARWKLPGEFQLAAKIPEIDLSELIDTLSAHSLRGDFPHLVLKDTFFFVERHANGGFYAAAGTTVEDFGTFEVDFVESGEATGFVFGFVLPETWSLTSLSSFFQPVDFLQFSSPSMIASSIDDPSFKFRSFEEPNFSFPAQLPSAPPGASRGLGLYADLKLKGGGLDVLAKLLKGLPGLRLGVRIPEKIEDTTLSAEMDAPFHLFGDIVVIQRAGVTITPGEESMDAFLGVLFSFHGHSLGLEGNVGLMGTEVEFDVHTTTAWKAPFGIKGLTIDKMGVGFTLGEMITVSLAGQITIGSGDKSALTLEAGAEFNGTEDGVPDVLLAREVGSIDLGQIISSFAPDTHIPAEILPIKLSDFQLIVVANPNGWDNPDDHKHYSPGLGVAGKLDFYGFAAAFAIEVFYDTGIYCMGQIDQPIDIGGVVKLSSVDRPTEVGPSVVIDSANSPYLKMSAALELFEIAKASVDIVVANDRFHLDLEESIEGLGAVSIKADWGGSTSFAFAATAAFAVEKVGPIKVGELNLGTLKLDLELDAHFAVAVSTTEFDLTIGAHFQLEGLKLKLDDLTIHDRPASLSDLPRLFADNLAALLWDIGKSLFQDAEALFEFIGKGLLAITDDITKILNHELGVAIHEAARLLKSVANTVEYDAEKVARLLADGFDAAEKDVAAAMKAAEYEVAEVARAIGTVFSKGAEEVADVLREAGYELGAIATVLKDVFGYEAEQVAKFFKDTWKVADHAVKSALDAAKFLGDEVEKAMKSVFGWVKHVVDKAKHDLNPKNW